MAALRPGALAGRFWRDERGSAAVEMMLVLPLLIWCFVGTFTFFEAFRLQTVNVKAAYTIGDQISRETNFVTPNYIQSMYNLHRFLVGTTLPTAVRITAFEYERDDDTYRVIWSRGVNRANRTTDGKIEDIRSALPIMPDEEIAILVETWADFEAADMVGLADFTSYEVVVTRPRFAAQICWNNSETGTSATGICQAGY